MINRDHRGNIRSTHRTVNTKLNAEILLGNDWQDIAYAELLRLTLEVNAYHVQLRDKPGYEETGTAYAALQSACDALIEAANQPGGQAEPSGRLV
jgi:hypothetical protein